MGLYKGLQPTEHPFQPFLKLFGGGFGYILVGIIRTGTYGGGSRNKLVRNTVYLFGTVTYYTRKSLKCQALLRNIFHLIFTKNASLPNP